MFAERKIHVEELSTEASIDRSILTDNGIPKHSASSVTRKNLQMSIKVAQNDFTWKMIDFDTFTKIE